MTIQILAIGTIIFLWDIGACFKAASFRSNLLKDWRDRVSLAEEGLADKAVSQLKKLNLQVGDLLVFVGRTDPEKALADPSLLLDNVRIFLRIMKAKIRIRRNFRIMLWTAPVFFGTLMILAPCIFVAFGTWGGLLDLPQIYEWILIVGMIALATLLLTFACYVYLQYALCDDEMLAMDDEINE